LLAAVSEVSQGGVRINPDLQLLITAIHHAVAGGKVEPSQAGALFQVTVKEGLASKVQELDALLAQTCQEINQLLTLLGDTEPPPMTG
jgi:hypothetical protein